jgi:hypothetical protein
MTKNPQLMTKKELVQLGAGLGLGSKAALDAQYVDVLRKKILDHLK